MQTGRVSEHMTDADVAALEGSEFGEERVLRSQWLVEINETVVNELGDCERRDRLDRAIHLEERVWLYQPTQAVVPQRSIEDALAVDADTNLHAPRVLPLGDLFLDEGDRPIERRTHGVSVTDASSRIASSNPSTDVARPS
jgi:hypothetical protein